METRAERVTRFLEDHSDDRLRKELEKARWPLTKFCPACGAKQPLYPTPLKRSDGVIVLGYYTCPGKSVVLSAINRASSKRPSVDRTVSKYEKRQAARSAVHRPSTSKPGSVKALVFTVKTGTVLSRSHIALSKWACALALRRSTRNTITATELGTLLNISRKTAGIIIRCMNDLYRESQGRDRSQAFIRNCAVRWGKAISGR